MESKIVIGVDLSLKNMITTSVYRNFGDECFFQATKEEQTDRWVSEWMERGTVWLISQAKENNADLIAVEKLNTNTMNCTAKQKAVFTGLLNSIPSWAKPNKLQIIKVDPPFTSKRCFCCGSLNTQRDDRSFLCYDCRYEENADVNAAKIIGIMGIINLIKNDKVRRIDWTRKYSLATSRGPLPIEKIDWALNLS